MGGFSIYRNILNTTYYIRYYRLYINFQLYVFQRRKKKNYKSLGLCCTISCWAWVCQNRPYLTSKRTDRLLSKSNKWLLRTIMVNRPWLSITAGVTSKVPLLFSKVSAYTDSLPYIFIYILKSVYVSVTKKYFINNSNT